jgi:hypothetical protein
MNRARPADADAGRAPAVPAGPPACTDAERRAARAYAAELRALGRPSRTEALWVRPAGAAVLATCAAAGVAGSVVSVDHPTAGLVLASVAFALAAAELGPWPVLRRLTFARATQNVVSEPPPGGAAAQVTLVLVAPVDGPRGGLAERAGLPVRAITTVALGVLAVCTAARVALDASGTLIGTVQLVPTALLVLAVGALADAAVAAPAPAPGGDPPAAVAVAAARMLAGVRLERVAVEVVLAGAWPLGFRTWLRRDRRRPEEVALAFVGSAAAPRYATAHPALRAVAEEARLAERRGRAPRAGRRPAIAIAGGAREAGAFVVALATGLDAALARAPAQPASSERFAKSVK